MASYPVQGGSWARITEAEREGWLGELEGLEAGLAGAQDKLAQLDAKQGPYTKDHRPWNAHLRPCRRTHLRG